jgi:selenide,water dikinase
MQTFLDRLVKKLPIIDSSGTAVDSKSKHRIVIVGGGVGSIEIAFCLDSKLKSKNSQNHEITLVTASRKIGHQLLAATQSKIERALNSRGIQVVLGSRVHEIHAGHLQLDDGSRINGDCFLWATQAEAPGVVECLGLNLDSAGFIAVRPTLQSSSCDCIFAVGDSATLIGNATPKAGVYAVRQGPILWENLKNSILGAPLIDYQPQSGFLKLINTGDNRAIAEYKGLSWHNRMAWKLKHRIDTKFMAMYQNPEPARMSVAPMADSPPRCLGCGGKIGSRLLSDVLRELPLPPHPDVIIGLEQPDDAAIVRAQDNQLTITTDFFASPINDPSLMGRIAVLNAASDLFVMGAKPVAALAMIQLPHGHPRGQARMMRELMAGSVSEISRMGASLVGGHTIEGSNLTIGFTFVGNQLKNLPPSTKGGLKTGDLLVISKPLGTGVLLAALMRSKAPGSAYQPLLESMLQSNEIALKLIEAGWVSAITDVTGFGLAGHLGEMLRASQQSARISIKKIPQLPGAGELLGQGIESTLAPDNRSLRDVVVEANLQDPRMAILFDPQTSGGLLLGVSPEKSPQLLQVLRDHGFSQAAVIGEIVGDGRPPVTLEVL